MVAASLKANGDRTYSFLLRGKTLARNLTREEAIDLVIAFHALEQEVEELKARFPTAPEIRT